LRAKFGTAITVADLGDYRPVPLNLDLLVISLFLLTIHLLSHRRTSPGIKLLMVMSCIMAVLGTAQMAVTIAQTVVQACFVQQDVQAVPQGLKEDESESISRFSVFPATRKFIVFINKWVNPPLFGIRTQPNPLVS
jgi:hypothetical protein